MSRTSKIIGFSVPPEVSKQLDRMAKQHYKTRSEFIREMIDTYEEVSKKPLVNNRINSLEEKDINLAKVLKTYWQLRSQLSSKVELVGVGIIVNKKGEVLIGARKGKDPWVKNLRWVFPGGGLESLDFEAGVKREIKEETGLEVNVNSLVAARIHPNAVVNKVQVVVLYFYCTPVNESTGKANDGLDELKWVKPLDVFKFFTTSVSDEVTKFLQNLEA